MGRGGKEGFTRSRRAGGGEVEANVYTARRFERSERGWPIVDISQLW